MYNYLGTWLIACGLFTASTQAKMISIDVERTPLTEEESGREKDGSEPVALFPKTEGEQNNTEAMKSSDTVDPLLIGLRSSVPLDRGYRYGSYSTTLFMAPNLVHWWIPFLDYGLYPQNEIVGDTGTLYLGNQWEALGAEYPLHRANAYARGNTGQRRAGICTLPQSNQTHGTNGGIMECGRVEAANFAGQTLSWSLKALMARNSNFMSTRFNGASLWDFNATGSNFNGAEITQSFLSNVSLSQGSARDLRVTRSYLDLKSGYASDYWYRYTHQSFSSHTLFSDRGIDLSGSRFEQSFLSLDCTGCDLNSVLIDRPIPLNPPPGVGGTQRRGSVSAIASNATGLRIQGGQFQKLELTCSLATGAQILPDAITGEPAVLTSLYLTSTDASNAIFNGAQIGRLEINERRYTCNGTRVRSSLVGSQLRNMTVSSAEFSGSNPSDLVNLDGASFSNSVFLYSGFEHVRAQAASFRLASLRGVLMNNVDLRSADLRNTDLTGARLRDVDLTGANLTGADLAGARYNSFTAQRFPSGFNPQARGMIFDDSL